MINVILFEDNLDFVDSLSELLQETKDIHLSAVFHHCKDIVRHVRYYKPDIIIMDIDMPGITGIEGLTLLRNADLDTLVMMLTVFDDNERVFQAVCRGASGYLLKSSSPEKIVDGIREAANGGAPMTPSVAKQVLKLFSAPYQKSAEVQNLTPKESEVLSFLVRGYSYKMIASQLKISIETIRFHVKNMYAKLHVNSKSEAVAKAIYNKFN